MKNLLKIAHRGAKGHWPENTLMAFSTALEAGCDGIELDVQLSADGQVVVFHDTTTDRMTGQTGIVSELALSALKKMTLGDTHQIPTLAEVLDLVDARCLVNIELKVAAAVEPVLALIEKYVACGWDEDLFLISSFDWNALLHTRKLHPEIPIGVLTETDLDLATAFAKTIQAETLHPHFLLLNAKNILEIQQQFGVFAWTVNEQEDIDKLKEWDVDALISDYPERL